MGDVKNLLEKLDSIDGNNLKNLLSDSDVDGLVGTNDLLTFLSNFALVIDDLDLDVTFDPNE